MRTFIAVELDDAIRSRLAEAQQQLRPVAGASVKWVKPELIHLTLKFLGEIDEGQVADVAEAMALAAAGAGAFELSVAGLGAFPPRGAPRVVWAGVEPHPALTALVERLEEGLEILGFARERRPYSPHLTLGRVKDPRGASALRGRLEAGAAMSFGARRVDDLVLMQSVLTTAGPTYTPLRRQPL